MAIIKLFRINQWLKNVLVFAPLFFAQEVGVPGALLNAFLAFITFSLTASALYAINDMVDIAGDRLHPIKKSRPLASGAVTQTGALIAAACLLIAAAFISIRFIPAVGPVLLAYALLSLGYSWIGKNIPVLDLLIVASFYVFRVVVGGLAVDAKISSWLILCVFFAALLIIIGKRRSEFIARRPRQVLAEYSLPLLDILMGIAASLTIATYALYTFMAHPSPLAIYSNFFVILGIFRYFYISYRSEKAEFPEQAIVSDPMLAIAVFLWVGFMYIITY